MTPTPPTFVLFRAPDGHVWLVRFTLAGDELICRSPVPTNYSPDLRRRMLRELDRAGEGARGIDMTHPAMFSAR